MKATKHLRRLFYFSICLAMVLSLLPAHVASAVSSSIVISQVYGGGGNYQGIYTNDFIELFNRGTTTVSLTGWSIQYTSATGAGNFGSASYLITPLTGSLAAGQYLLIQEAAGASVIAPLPTPDVTDPSPINMSGSGGKVALVNTTTPLGCNGGSTPCSAGALATIVDLVGWDGANFFEGSGPAPATSNSTADYRLAFGCLDTDNNQTDFTNGMPNPRNTASPTHNCNTPFGIGSANPKILFTGNSTLLSMLVYPAINPNSTGLAVTCDLTSIDGQANQTLYDDGTNGDVTAGDSLFSFLFSIPVDAPWGVNNLPCAITDAQSRTGEASIGLTVLKLIPIGEVNGPVLDTDNAVTHASPYVNQLVTIQGVIYEKTLQAISNSANTYKGFYLQNTSDTSDGDLNTSDGLFVFMNTPSNMNILGGGIYTPTVGDEVVLTGMVSEYFNMTELTTPYLSKPVVRSGVDLDSEVPAFTTNPAVSLAEANRYWERHQGMRAQVPADSIVLNGRNVFNPADGEVWVARSDSAIAQRTDVYTRRAFRDAHPLDDNYDPASWDGNGYRILLGSLGIKATQGDAQALIAPAHTFDTVTNAPIGGVNYTFSKYRVEITDQITLNDVADPAANHPPTEISDRSAEYSIVDYNLENLYDYRNNPFSGCDFAGDSGCPLVAPFLAGVKSPFDYVPASDGAYQARLTDIARQIINDLYSPDILMLQEVENQDICTVSGAGLTCGATDNADGRPDVLQDLALKITELGGPEYDSAFDRNSSDLRGILPAYLYRTDRVELLPPDGDPVLASNPAIEGFSGVPANSDVSNPKSLNAYLPAGITACETSWVFPRAPSVALFRIFSTSIGEGDYTDVYAINNHFKSGPDSCVGHRTEQAMYNAALIAYLQGAVPGAHVVDGGDLNVYPRPDDPFAPLGQPKSSDQLGSLYDPALGLTNLWDVLLGQAPESAYSYVYLGMAQTLDQMFVNPALLSHLTEFRIAHINSDFAADYAVDVARGTSDHDPNVAVFSFAEPPSVNGGGWIRSPAGAYTTDPLMTGKGEFAFDAKYVKNSLIPVGSVSYMIESAGLSFSSTSYDWLMVNGNSTWLRGTGTFNGADGYSFLLTVFDGSDAFRIQIWDSAGVKIYDSQPGDTEFDFATTLLGGGKVTIH